MDRRRNGPRKTTLVQVQFIRTSHLRQWFLPVTATTAVTIGRTDKRINAHTVRDSFDNGSLFHICAATLQYHPLGCSTLHHWIHGKICGRALTYVNWYIVSSFTVLFMFPIRVNIPLHTCSWGFFSGGGGRLSIGSFAFIKNCFGFYIYFFLNQNAHNDVATLKTHNVNAIMYSWSTSFIPSGWMAE